MGAGNSPGLDEHQQFDHDDLGPSCPSTLSCAGGGWWVQGGCHRPGSISLSPGSTCCPAPSQGWGCTGGTPSPGQRVGPRCPFPPFPSCPSRVPPSVPVAPQPVPLETRPGAEAPGILSRCSPFSPPLSRDKRGLFPVRGARPGTAAGGMRDPRPHRPPQPCVGWGDTGCTVDGGLWLS